MNTSEHLNLTQPEIIQILRRRSDMNQGTFGAKAFNTSFESGRTKVKNIELGRQVPTRDDVRKMAAVLGVAATDLMPRQDQPQNGITENHPGIRVTPQVLECFDGLGPYLEMLNKSVMLDDPELVGYIAKKIALLMEQGFSQKMAAGSGSE